MSEITAILTRTNPLGTTLLLIGDDLLSDGELVTSAEVGKDVFEKLLTFAENNQEVRVVISYSDDSHLKLYDYANTVVEDEYGYKGIILEKTGICLYNGTTPAIGDDIAPFVNAGGGGSDLPEVDSDDNGKVLTVVSGEWDKATPASLPSVTNTDNGKILKVKNGAWTKDWQSLPSNMMLVMKLELQDWDTDYILTTQEQGTTISSQSAFDPPPDVIEIRTDDNGVKTAFSLGEYRRYYLNDVPADYDNVSWKSLDGQHSIVIDNTTEATTVTIEGFTFTFLTGSYANDFWSCSHN